MSTATPALTPEVARTPHLVLLNVHKGRESLDHVLDSARDGVGRALVLRGEPGTGKTSLLEYAIGRAPDMRVARAAGVEPETALGFAGLHQLLIPLLPRLGRLPGPQRDALQAAFGLAAAPAPDRFLFGLAVLSLLADAAADQPLLVAVDDAQWLDQPTMEVLAFVARRLCTEPIAFVLAMRESGTPCWSLDGLPELYLAGSAERHAPQPSERPRTQRVFAAVVDPPAAAASELSPAGGSSLDDLVTLAWRGSEAEARPAAADQLRDWTARGLALGVTTAHYALTILELGLGRYEAALTCALSVYRDDPPDLGTQVLPELVEAATRSGNMDTARAAVDRLSGRALASGTPLARGLLTRSRALLADDREAEDLYREAIDQLGRSSTAGQLARAHLLYGEWLRRRRRRRDAREQLYTARDMFDTMGFEAFARRTWVELQATGERASKRTGKATDHLTPQEAQVARLVAEGSSNRQVAAQLFISLNTVEYHLQKVFRKIGVSSRTQLVRTLLDQAQSGPTGALRI